MNPRILLILSFFILFVIPVVRSLVPWTKFFSFVPKIAELNQFTKKKLQRFSDFFETFT